MSRGAATVERCSLAGSLDGESDSKSSLVSTTRIPSHPHSIHCTATAFDRFTVLAELPQGVAACGSR